MPAARLATVPAVEIGYTLEKLVRDAFATPLLAAAFLIVNGVLLFAGERLKSRGSRRTHGLGYASQRESLGERIPRTRGSMGAMRAVTDGGIVKQLQQQIEVRTEFRRPERSVGVFRQPLRARLARGARTAIALCTGDQKAETRRYAASRVNAKALHHSVDICRVSVPRVARSARRELPAIPPRQKTTIRLACL